MQSPLVTNMQEESNNTIDIEPFIDFNLTNFGIMLEKYDQVLSAMSVAQYGLECYELDRFLGMPDEMSLESEALTLSENGNFLAGLLNLNQYQISITFYLQS